LISLSALLDDGALRNPVMPAFTENGETLDWTAFATLANRHAAALRAVGVRPGDSVALWLPNSADALALVFACARLGALAVNVNTRFRSAEVGDLLARARARVLVTEWGFEPVDFPGILAALPADRRPDLAVVLGRGLPEGDGACGGIPAFPLARPGAGPVPDAALPEALAVTFTTSGTTSGPKLVAHTQASLAGHALDVARACGLDQAGASLLAAVPFCGTFGLGAALAAVAGGAHIVGMDRFDARQAVDLVRSHAITHIVGGDDMMARMVEAAGDERFTSVRWFGFAAFSSTAAATALAADALGLQPCGVYGSSEMQALFSMSRGAHRLRSGGRPVNARAAVSVRDPHSGERVADGQPGELCFEAPSRFAGYLGDDAATAQATTDDGWFRSGGLGRLDGGDFVFEARLGDALRLGGFMVGPEEIEGFLVGLPGVSGAQVVAVEAPEGPRLIAFITTAPSATVDEADLRARCLAGMARFKVPARIIPLQGFPTTDGPNGRKIQRVRLREMALATIEAGHPNGGPRLRRP
jgi:fatty-acyl-CoA synthase